MLYDILFLAIIIIAIIHGARRGAAKTLLSFVAFLLAAVFSVLLSRMLSLFVYSTFIRGALESRISDFITQTPLGTVVFQSAEFLASLPAFFLGCLDFFGLASGFSQGLFAQGDDLLTTDGAVAAVSQTIEPVITGLLSVVLGIVLFFILRFLFMRLANSTSKVFRRPLLRFPDSLAGGVLGAAKGCLTVILLVMLISLLLPIIPENRVFISEEKLLESHIFSFVYTGNLLLIVQNFIYRIA